MTLSRDGAELARASYTAAAFASVDVPIAWTPSPGGVTVSIDDNDGFTADNARHVIVGATESSAVLVVNSPDSTGFYLDRALEAAHADSVSPVSALSSRLVSPAQIAGGRAADVSRHRAVVLLSTRGLDRSARDAISAFVKGGGGLLIAAGPDLEADVISAMFGWKAGSLRADGNARQASFTATDARHPIFRPFGPLAANLGQVRFTRAWRVDPAGWRVAAQFDDGAPAVLERAEGSGRVVLFASDLDRRWNDFPLHPSFVPFVVESVRHVAARRVEASEFIVGRTPAGVSAEPGLHRLADGRLVAVNVDARESATAAMTPAEFAGMLEPVRPGRTATGRPRRADRVPSESVAVRIVPDAGDAGDRVVHRESVMASEFERLAQLLSSVRRRWFMTVALRTAGTSMAVAAVPILAASAVYWIFAPGGMGLLLLAGLTSVLAIAGVATVIRRIERRPDDRRVARFIEERVQGMPGNRPDGRLRRQRRSRLHHPGRR